MPKLKTRKSAQKRVKITSGGKFMRGHVLMSHLKSKKSAKRKRRKSRPAEVAKAEYRRLKRLIPYRKS